MDSTNGHAAVEALHQSPEALTRMAARNGLTIDQLYELLLAAEYDAAMIGNQEANRDLRIPRHRRQAGDLPHP